MNFGSRNRFIVIIAAVFILLVSILGWETWGLFRMRMEVACAEEQTRTFDEARGKALASDPTEAAGCLEYVVIYYPSGSKQRIGSHLDLVVERHRAIVSQEIIQHLRQKTGDDLGDKPEAWIQKYAKKQ